MNMVYYKCSLQNIHKTNDDIYLTLTHAIINMRYSGIISF